VYQYRSHCTFLPTVRIAEIRIITYLKRHSTHPAPIYHNKVEATLNASLSHADNIRLSTVTIDAGDENDNVTARLKGFCGVRVNEPI
jgi:hypothetical protein